MILALDPGTTQTAYVCLDGSRVVECGIVANDELLAMLRSVGRYDGVQTVAVEMIASYGMPVGREVFETCVWIGRFVENVKVPWRLVYRMEAKLHLCHTPKAKDGNIRQSLLDRFGPVGTKKSPGPLYGVKSHIWAALAVAVFAMESKDAQTLQQSDVDANRSETDRGTVAGRRNAGRNSPRN